MAGQRSSDKAGQTMYGPMMLVALEQTYPPDLKLVNDELAIRMLPRSMQVMVKAASLPGLKSGLLGLLERRAPGVVNGVLCRKMYIHDKTLQGMKTGIQTVVNLGAGLDTHAFQKEFRQVPVYEVDLPENIRYKQTKMIEVFGRVPENLNLVPVDFMQEDLASALSRAGYRQAQKTFFIWEAVTQYLSLEGVRKTFDFLARSISGSQLVFTYIDQRFIDGSDHFGLEKMYQAYRRREQIWQFGLLPDQVGSFLAEFGWSELEQVGSPEYQERYLQPRGRQLAVMPIERAVFAQKS
jgi:methyltransferase (TIGR00027 family)